MKCNVFVYGRTKNEDYRWLQKPNIPLKSNFFAKIIENNSNSLKKDQKLFMFVSSSELYMLAYIFKDFSSLDERGRPISFVVGLTCNPKKGRVFNYHLPALLLHYNLITNLIQNDLTKVINTNSSFKIEDFNISQVNYLISKDLISDLEQNGTTINNSILEVAQRLNNTIITPNSESNFKVTELNNLLKGQITPILKVKQNLNNKVTTPNSESNIDLTEPSNPTFKIDQKLKNNATPSSLKLNFQTMNNIHHIAEKEKHQANSALMNQLENFDTNEKDSKDSNIASTFDDLKEVINFGSSPYLAKLYHEKRQKSFLKLNNNITFKKNDFFEVYQELKNYDKIITIAYEQAIKNK